MRTSAGSQERAGVQARFAEALAAFIERVKGDPYILAVVVAGSMSHDTVWEKSDLDLIVLTRDEGGTGRMGKKAAWNGWSLVECGVIIHASLMPRSAFKQRLEGAATSSFTHSLIAKSTLAYTREAGIREWWENIGKLGTRDREGQLLRAASWAAPTLLKAEKWFHVKRDFRYAALWALHCATPLAQIEVLLEGQITGREVLAQAMGINPEFFGLIYEEFMDRKKTEKEVGRVLEAINDYLMRKRRAVFGPLLEYLKEAEGPRSATEIETYFQQQYGSSGVTSACEWLAEKDVLVLVGTPVFLNKQSRQEFEEMAFVFDG